VAGWPRPLRAEHFLQDECVLGEGPFWFEGRLYWVDIERGLLLSVDGRGGDRRSHSVGRRLGAAAPIEGRRFVVAVQDGIGILDTEAGSVSILASPEASLPGSRFNDGKCDPAGRFLAGTLDMDGQERSSGLYSIDGRGRLRRLLDGVTISNGLAWTADGGTLYHIDTPTFEIARFDYDVATGTLGERHVVVRVPPEMGFPDGMEIDANGDLWVAHWDGGAVRCWSPRTGRCLTEVRLPCSRPTSCCFGGPDLDRLFITTARIGLSETALAGQPLAGGLFSCQVGVAGSPVRLFGGTATASYRIEGASNADGED
jgi:sugar lactone lactonase YvrE